MNRILTLWDLEPTVIAGCAALLAAYFALVRGARRKEAALFAGGVAAILVALCSPIDVLADTYLFSAHMLQHLLLILVAAPLLLLGIPDRAWRRVVAWKTAGRVERALRSPVAAWTVGMGTLALWHLPRLYDAALASEALHVVEHLCFLVSAAIFWWPAIAPLGEARMPPLVAMLYLFAAAMANSVLGIVLTFAPAGTYSAYANPDDALGLLSLLREDFGLTPAVDQQVGGMLMWVVSAPIFLGPMLAALARWYSTPDTPQRSLR